MSTWARTATSDMLLPAIGLGASESIVTDPDQCCAIRIQDGLRLWKGNWALDQNQGFPWPQVLANKQVNLVSTSNLLRKAIALLGAPWVIASRIQVTLAFLSRARSLAVTFTAPTTTGATIVGGSAGPANLIYVVVQ